MATSAGWHEDYDKIVGAALKEMVDDHEQAVRHRDQRLVPAHPPNQPMVLRRQVSTFRMHRRPRRLRVRGEKRDDIQEALVHLANAMICWGRLNGHLC